MISPNSSTGFKKFNQSYYKSSQEYGNSYKRMSIMASFIEKNKKVLDIGCGDGTFFSFINSPKKYFYGLDISPKALKFAKKYCVHLKVSDLHQRLPYSDNIFDYVSAGEVIEHIFDTDYFLSEIKRVLKPNGSIVLSTPNLATLGRRIMLLFGLNPLIDTSLRNSAGHIRYFTYKSLKELLNYHKFKIINFASDVVNFNNKGNIKSYFIAKIYPKLGARLIIKAKNLK